MQDFSKLQVYQISLKCHVILIVTHFPLPSSPPSSHPHSCWWTIPLPLLQRPRPVTPHRAKAEGGSFPWCFYWPQQMASLSLCIVTAAIFLWGSGLTIVASSCGRQKPSRLPKRVSLVTERCKTGNAVKFTTFTRCEDTACQVQASAGKHCLAWVKFGKCSSPVSQNCVKIPNYHLRH